jgi:hypothetical protein
MILIVTEFISVDSFFNEKQFHEKTIFHSLEAAQGRQSIAKYTSFIVISLYRSNFILCNVSHCVIFCDWAFVMLISMKINFHFFPFIFSLISHNRFLRSLEFLKNTFVYFSLSKRFCWMIISSECESFAVKIKLSLISFSCLALF